MGRREAAQLHVRGVVQGVGFRPFVHRLAIRHDLGGWIRNESGEVRVEVEGTPDHLRHFVADLRNEAPPLVRIDALEVIRREPRQVDTFQVVSSAVGQEGRLPICPDVAICPVCRRELLDPKDRRHRYPFITCTDCGPRFTVIETMPYDRVRTSMHAFSQCPTCLEEYHTPSDRRYHSETNSCPECGPRLWILGGDRERLEEGEEALARGVEMLLDGAILAIRGLGGFHLAVDATSEEGVCRLRERKERPAKPLAVMVKDLNGATELGEVGREEARLLTSAERPIVLLKVRPGSRLASSVAPGLDTVGVMTAYTPMHLLLLRGVGRPLVMTSGNASDEPIAIGNEEGVERLGGIADAFLLHDREIVARCDDSIVRVVDESPVFLRRARGFAPLPLDLPFSSPVPLVAVGPHLKNTFALIHGKSVYLSQHIGDLENLETLQHFHNALERFRTLFNVTPEIVVRDRHPGYLSTRIADEMALGRVIEVQHHHAHIAAVAAEHGVTEPVIGVAYDGTGHGDDGCVWGGELLVADLTSFRRVASLRYSPLPGGEAAIRQPWRTALGYLSLDPDAAEGFDAALAGVTERELAIARTQIERGLNAPLASSMGRLFDAVAAVLGVRQRCSYEGEAAMELEAIAGNREAQPLPFPVREGEGGVWVLDPIPLLSALNTARAAGESVPELAAAFHESVAESTAMVVERVADESGVRRVALGGGCFQNARLLSRLWQKLIGRGLEVLTPLKLSPNDGAISYGQAAVAAGILRSEMGR